MTAPEDEGYNRSPILQPSTHMNGRSAVDSRSFTSDEIQDSSILEHSVIPQKHMGFERQSDGFDGNEENNGQSTVKPRKRRQRRGGNKW